MLGINVIRFPRFAVTKFKRTAKTKNHQYSDRLPRPLASPNLEKQVETDLIKPIEGGGDQPACGSTGAAEGVDPESVSSRGPGAVQPVQIQVSGLITEPQYSQNVLCIGFP